MTEVTTVPVRVDGPRHHWWDAADLVGAVRDQMGRVWPARFARHPDRGPAANPVWFPQLDIFEKDNSLVVKAELPGLERKDVQVVLDQDELVIQGERELEREVAEADYYRCECSYGGFYRRLRLPSGTTADMISANLLDGVLEVRVKLPEEARARPVQIAVK